MYLNIINEHLEQPLQWFFVTGKRKIQRLHQTKPPMVTGMGNLFSDIVFHIISLQSANGLLQIHHKDN
jgi:hypothetical protein